MKYLKYFLLLNALVVMSCTSFAQKQTFDVVSFAFPKGWQEQKSEAGIQLSITDKKTGVYGIAVITKAKASSASANENFNNDWDKLVKGAVAVDTAPSISDMGIETGWSCVTGQANYVDGNNKGLATLITATGYGQTASVVIMTNTSKYQEEILAFVNSLELAKLAQVPATTNASAKSSVVGLWCNNILETTGTYINGSPQYTAGYMRKEYAFYPDGTYLFRNKNWQTTMKEILFIYETGTYSVNGNQLALTPKQGKGGWWSKAPSGRTTEWGSLVKASNYKMENKTYSFEITYYSGTKNYSLILMPNNSNKPQDEISYSNYGDRKSIIDNPPGFKIGL